LAIPECSLSQLCSVCSDTSAVPVHLSVGIHATVAVLPVAVPDFVISLCLISASEVLVLGAERRKLSRYGDTLLLVERPEFVPEAGQELLLSSAASGSVLGHA
jgi:hypothetical protein